MSTKLHIGNVPFAATAGDLRELFEQYGEVDRVAMITHRTTGLPRGFAFVEMANVAGAASARRGLDGQDVGGGALRVSEASGRTAVGGARIGRL